MSQSKIISLTLPIDLLNQLETFIKSQNEQSLDNFVSLAIQDKLTELNLKVITDDSLPKSQINPENDPIWLLGSDLVEDTITDAVKNLDNYLYNQV